MTNNMIIDAVKFVFTGAKELNMKLKKANVPLKSELAKAIKAQARTIKNRGYADSSRYVQ